MYREHLSYPNHPVSFILPVGINRTGWSEISGEGRERSLGVMTKPRERWLVEHFKKQERKTHLDRSQISRASWVGIRVKKGKTEGWIVAAHDHSLILGHPPTQLTHAIGTLTHLPKYSPPPFPLTHSDLLLSLALVVRRRAPLLGSGKGDKII
jgi:hypothetical protein